MNRRLFLQVLGSAAASPVYAADDVAVSDFIGARFPYAEFERLPARSLAVSGGDLRIAFVNTPATLTEQQVLQWISNRAHAVAEYFETLPSGVVRLLVVFSDGAGVQGGSSFGFRGAACRIVLGKQVTASQLERDWVLVHELVHTGFPSVASEHHWMEEGLATYVEPIIQIRAGLLSESAMWKDLREGLPKGLPAAGDAGLDHTPTWGRTYWGGALFYFLTDLEIRQRTDNAYSLRDALIALNRAGGNITQEWSVDRALATMDRVTGAQACRHMYERMKDSPYDVSLDDVWRNLGVTLRDGVIGYEDAAPLAHIRRALTRKDTANKKRAAT